MLSFFRSNSFFIFIFSFLPTKSYFSAVKVKYHRAHIAHCEERKRINHLNTNDWSLDPINFSNHPKGTYDIAKSKKEHKGLLFMTIRRCEEEEKIEIEVLTIDYIPKKGMNDWLRVCRGEWRNENLRRDSRARNNGW